MWAARCKQPVPETSGCMLIQGFLTVLSGFAVQSGTKSTVAKLTLRHDLVQKVIFQVSLVTIKSRKLTFWFLMVD